jgi:hypothetical protein
VSTPGTGGGPLQPRLFTLAEAEAMLSVIAPILIELRDTKRRLDEAQGALARLSPAMRVNGHGKEVLALEEQIADHLARLAVGVHEINGRGIEVKDIDQGLVDFPAKRDNRIVYLCWHLGEDRIAFWHELDAGFAGRQPL